MAGLPMVCPSSMITVGNKDGRTGRARDAPGFTKSDSWYVYTEEAASL